MQSRQEPIVDMDWSKHTNQALIEHILSRFHQVHRQQFKALIELADRVEVVHGAEPDCPVGLCQHLQMMQAELEQHMQKEEMILFPMLANGNRSFAAGPISVMLAEHQDHMHAIATIYQLTNELKLPKIACQTWRKLYRLLEEFIEDINTHMHLENDVLFMR